MKKRGIGVGCMFYGIGYGFARQDISAATVEICEDGSVIVRSGEVDYGQGSDTIFCQIVAEELGLDYADIQLIAADTLTTPNAGPTSASRVTYVTGMAMKKAASQVRESMRKQAERVLGADDLLFEEGRVFSRSQPDKAITFAKLAKATHLAGLPVVATAWHDITTKDVDPETGQGDAYSTYAWASQLAVVEVDTDTGKVDVLRVIAAHDVGKAINPQNVEAQIEGGTVTGMGYALEEVIKINNGVVQTSSLSEYMLPTCLDAPNIECHIVEVPAPDGPYGAKGVGEPALIPTAPAVLKRRGQRLGSQGKGPAGQPGKPSPFDSGTRVPERMWR